MNGEQNFARWMGQVRAGDDAAAAELVRLYERHIRIAIRVRLTDPNLRRQFDSMDICQSVLQSFFVRAAAGQYDLSTPDRLIGLLVQMARNKFAMYARHYRRQKRDVQRGQTNPEAAATLVDTAPGPERCVSGRELLQALLDALAPDERELAQRRASGQTWPEIAADLGGTAPAHRMKLRRGINRVAPILGLDGDVEED